MPQITRRAFMYGSGLVVGSGFPSRRRRGIQEISECTVIDEPGRYVLARSIPADHIDNDEFCIEVTADNVVLDGNGHGIGGHNGGIRVTGDNVTVQNFNGLGEDWALVYDGVKGGLIRNNEDDSQRGIRLRDTEAVDILDCDIYSAFFTLVLENTSGGRVAGNTLGGDQPFILRNSDRYLIRDNVFEDSVSEGAAIWSSSRNVIRDNTVIAPELGGFVLSNAHRNRLLKNTVERYSGSPIDDPAYWLRRSDRNLLVKNDYDEFDEYDDDVPPAYRADDSERNRLVKNSWQE